MGKAPAAIAFVALFAGVALFSTIEVASKLIGARVHPFQMVFIRFFLTGLTLLALARPALRQRAVRLGPRDYGVLALNGGIGFALALVLFHAAILVFEKAASCAVVFSANPIFVLLLARFVNREPWSAPKWAAMAAGLAGVACFAWESGAFTRQSLTAIGLMLAAALLFALSVCIVRRVIKNYGVFVLTGYSALFGSLMVLPFALLVTARQGVDGLASAWAPTLYVALPGTALAYGLYYFGLGRGTAFQAGMMFFLKPVMASALAVLVLREHINGFMLLGSALIVGGLAITVGGHLLAPRAQGECRECCEKHEKMIR
ncbi:MAG: DMT family transporter [Kiritimatiellae bacterium]|nr:DMT family transporter [Kiritimatiellia bacterium]